MAEELTPEARAWAEYLAWTRGADDGQYDDTERRAWERLERALLPQLAGLEAPPEEPDDLSDLLAPPSDDPSPRA